MQENGLWPHQVQPPGVDRRDRAGLVDLPLANLELLEPPAPLALRKYRLGIMQRLLLKIAGGGNHGKQYGALGASELLLCTENHVGPVWGGGDSDVATPRCCSSRSFVTGSRRLRR